MCSILTSSEVQYTCGWANESQCDGIGFATDLRFERDGAFPAAGNGFDFGKL